MRNINTVQATMETSEAKPEDINPEKMDDQQGSGEIILDELDSMNAELNKGEIVESAIIDLQEGGNKLAKTILSITNFEAQKIMIEVLNITSKKEGELGEEAKNNIAYIGTHTENEKILNLI